MAQTIVLIHGLFLTYASWEHWIARYHDRGYDAVALPWLGLDRSVEELRADPEPLTKLDIATVVDDLAIRIAAFEEPPIVMGHSFGGLFAQLLAYRGLASAAVGIDAVAPAGVLQLPFSTLKASAPVLANPLNIGKATMLDPEQFRYAFTNTLTAEEAQPLYDRYAIPCVNRILFEGAFENFVPHSPARIDVAANRCPLLLIGGNEDHLVPASFTRGNYDLIKRSPAITALHIFEGRPHFTGGVPGWETVADAALDWATNPTASITGAEEILGGRPKPIRQGEFRR